MQQEIQPDSASPVVSPAAGQAAADQSQRSRAVGLSIPAERDQVVLVRSVASHIGSRLGLSVAQITDLRLAVDEACGLFLLSDDFAALILECRFEELPDTLRITVSAVVPPTVEPDVDDIGWIMLGSLVDELTWQVSGDIGTVTLLIRLARGA
jgi:serine/threonine-protein kinase RsbW